MASIDRFKRILKLLFALPYSIWFNFRHLPFKQAVKLPIFVCNPRISGKGRYIINGEIKTRMIQLGFPKISIFRGTGINIENRGTIIFNGSATFGANSGISVGNSGQFIIGDRFVNTYGMKVVCYHEIAIGEKVRIGWESLLCDTDLHSLKSEDGLKHAKGFGGIKIGNEVWIGSFCKIYKNSEIPRRCTVAANTLINKKIECQPYSLIYSGGGIKVKYTGFYRDIDDDKIDYTLS